VTRSTKCSGSTRQCCLIGFTPQQFAATIYPEPAQLLRLGEDRAGMLMPWLDEPVALTIDGPAIQRLYRNQALQFAVLDVLFPFIKTYESGAWGAG
jgi:hypothetical protein